MSKYGWVFISMGRLSKMPIFLRGRSIKVQHSSGSLVANDSVDRLRRWLLVVFDVAPEWHPTKGSRWIPFDKRESESNYNLHDRITRTKYPAGLNQRIIPCEGYLAKISRHSDLYFELSIQIIIISILISSN